ncbi:MAG TPA: AraC family transcriptional regulator, partial [Rhodocyclaceae bacterium]|nr:AraC family transcriptional regulator [Rhodocyclaceae bacterium]
VHYLSPHADPLAASSAPRLEMGPIDCEVQESVALACGFFDFKSGLDDVFLGPLPDYVVVTKRSGQLQELRPLFDLILAEARTSNEEASPLITRLVDLLFFYVIRHVCRRNEVSAGLWAILARPEFAALLQAVIADPAKDWTVESMADVAHMSRATFHKRFAQACGNSPSHFLLQVRMRLASRLIERGTSLSRVAEKVGYQSDAAFSRAFKKATGTLPGAYKRSQQKADLLAA